MRKAERLFQILTLLRGRRTVITALELAEKLEVSERTIYRDIQALSLSGVPIESETGVGYRLKSSFNIPPLMFNESELEALLLGARMVQGWSGEEMGKAADSALQKIHAVLPDRLHLRTVQQPEWLIVPDLHRIHSAKYSDQISDAIKKKYVLQIEYTREDGKQSDRDVWPLGLIYWGRTWTLIAWCEKRNDYRMFRLDRIKNLDRKNQYFETTDVCNLQHYMSLHGEGSEGLC
jgi:predicted DNA-binding transcriptional regulator YafY